MNKEVASKQQTIAAMNRMPDGDLLKLCRGEKKASAMPPANAATRQTAGSFTQQALDGPALRCDVSGEKGQTVRWIRFRNAERWALPQPACVRFGGIQQGRARAWTGRKKGR